jgi:hypothetical protein
VDPKRNAVAVERSASDRAKNHELERCLRESGIVFACHT